MSIYITDKTQFEAQLANAGDKLVVVDFFATWCPPCMKISPVVDKHAEAYAGQVIFLKVDVDKNKNISSEYGVRRMPTFIFFRNGQKLEEFCGAVPDLLDSTIKKHLK